MTRRGKPNIIEVKNGFEEFLNRTVNVYVWPDGRRVVGSPSQIIEVLAYDKTHHLIQCRCHNKPDCSITVKWIDPKLWAV